MNPNHPNHNSAGSEDRHGQVVGHEGGVVAVTLALAHHQGRGQRRDTGVDVDDRAAGEVQGPQFAEPAAVTPDPVGHRVIDEGDPKDREHQKGD